MNKTIGDYFKQLTVLFVALSSGCAILIGVFYFLSKDNTEFKDTQFTLILEMVGIGVGFAMAIAARFLFFNTCRGAISKTKLSEKLNIYRTAILLQMALLEGGCLLNIILYFIGKSSFNLAVACGLLFLMVMRRPTRPLAAMLLFTPAENSRLIYDDAQIIE